MTLSAYRHFLMLLRLEQKEIEERERGESPNSELNGKHKSRRMTVIEAEIEILRGLEGPVDYALRKEQFLNRLNKR